MKFFLFILSFMVLFGCYYDKEEILYPGSGYCTAPATSTFTVDVLPLLNNRCNSCHSGTSPSGGISLNNYTEVKKYVTNGSLVGSINHIAGYSAMPKNTGKLSACEIEKIQKWVNAGATNN